MSDQDGTARLGGGVTDAERAVRLAAVARARELAQPPPPHVPDPPPPPRSPFDLALAALHAACNGDDAENDFRVRTQWAMRHDNYDMLEEEIRNDGNDV